MFDNIDMFLINWSQYGVRQFELYTSINRKNLLNFFLFLMMSVNIIIFLLAIISLFFGYEIGIPILFSTVGSTAIYFGIKNASAHQKETDILPREIVSRKKERFNVFFYSTVIFFMSSAILILIFPILDKISTNVNILLSLFDLVFVFSFPFLAGCTEYLLCTVSLPPGEKQKRLEEKEMKNMIPIPLGH